MTDDATVGLHSGQQSYAVQDPYATAGAPSADAAGYDAPTGYEGGAAGGGGYDAVRTDTFAARGGGEGGLLVALYPNLNGLDGPFSLWRLSFLPVCLMTGWVCRGGWLRRGLRRGGLR